MDYIIFNCPECGARIGANHKDAGAFAVCVKCAKRIKVPFQSSDSPTAPKTNINQPADIRSHVTGATPYVSEKNQEVAIGKLGYRWGYTFASVIALTAIVNIYNSMETTHRLMTQISEDPANQVEYLTQVLGTHLLNIFLIAATVLLFLKHKSTIKIVYTLAVISALRVLIRGVIGGELAVWLAFWIPSLSYFRKRKTIFTESSNAF